MSSDMGIRGWVPGPIIRANNLDIYANIRPECQHK